MSAAETSLSRTLTLPWLVLYGLGTTIGAGIYALVGLIAGRAGLLAPATFAAASLLALFTALSFAELGARFPRAGGAAVFALEGFGRPALANAVGLLVVAAGLVSAAAVSVAFAGHAQELFGLAPKPVLVGLIVAIGAVAVVGVRESVVFAGLVTLVEIGGLLLVIWFARDAFAELPTRADEFLPTDVGGWEAIGAATMLCFYAFIGFEDLVNMAEEARDPRRAMSIAIVTTLLVTVVLYVLLATVAVLTVPPAELEASGAPLALVFERAGGRPEWLGGIAAVALVNGALIQVLMASRVLYGLSREGTLPAGLGRVDPRTRTPLRATVLCTGAVLLLALGFPLASLAETTSAITLAAFAVVNAALVAVKRRDPAGPAGGLRVPSFVPALGFAISGAVLAHRLFAG